MLLRKKWSVAPITSLACEALEATVNTIMLKCLSLAATCSFATLAAAQEPSELNTEGWRELPRNTTVYVPAPRPVLPVAAFSSCSNRYEGDSCEFSSPSTGIVEGTCEAPELKQPPAYGYEQRQYPQQIRTSLVCTPNQPVGRSANPTDTGEPAVQANPGHETPLPPRAPDQ